MQANHNNINIKLMMLTEILKKVKIKFFINQTLSYSND